MIANDRSVGEPPPRSDGQQIFNETAPEHDDTTGDEVYHPGSERAEERLRHVDSADVVLDVAAHSIQSM